jgi:hypothetical protein
MAGPSILDGRNRWRACQALGIQPAAVAWDGVGDPLDYVLSVNLPHRQLGLNQRAMIAGRLVADHGVTQRRAAALLVTHHSSVNTAVQILRKGTAAEIEGVEQGLLAFRTVLRRIRERRAACQEPIADIIPLYPPLRRNLPTAWPKDMTAEQVGRRAIELHKQITSFDAVAKQIGVDVKRLRMVVDIVTVADRPDLSERDAKTAAMALRHMNIGSYRLEDIRETIMPLTKRLWGHGKSGRMTREAWMAQRLDRFEHGIGILIQSCANGTRIEIPHLGRERVQPVLNDLHRAIRNIRTLIGKIEGLQ